MLKILNFIQFHVSGVCSKICRKSYLIEKKPLKIEVKAPGEIFKTLRFLLNL